MSRMRWQLALCKQQLGWAGLIAIVGFVCALIYFFAILGPSAKSLNSARLALLAAKTERKPNTFSTTIIAKPEIQLQQFSSNFPEIDSINETWEQLAQLSEDAGLAIDHTHYDASTDKHAGLLPYKLNIPVKATYPQIRDFLAAVIESLPNVALEALTFKRENVDSPIVEASIALVIYVKAP